LHEIGEVEHGVCGCDRDRVAARGSQTAQLFTSMRLVRRHGGGAEECCSTLSGLAG
jgi:hypothetical protein